MLLAGQTDYFSGGGVMDKTDKALEGVRKQIEKDARLLRDAVPKDLGGVFDSMAGSKELARIAVGQLSGLGGFPKGLIDGHTEAARQIAESISGIGPYEKSLASAVGSVVAGLASSRDGLAELIAGQASAYGALAGKYAEMAGSIVGELQRSGVAAEIEKIMDVCGRLDDLPWPTAAFELDDATQDAVRKIQATLSEQAACLERLCDGETGLVAGEIVARRPAGLDFIRRFEPSQTEVRFAELRARPSQTQLTLVKLCLKQKLWSEAEQHSREAAESMEDSAEPYIGLGIALNAQGRHEAAAEAFEEAERRDPECMSRADVRAVYEASLEGRRWDGRLDEAGPEA